jgi:hypothetical protein
VQAVVRAYEYGLVRPMGPASEGTAGVWGR